ncbi:hypothetical protein [Cytobacillus oceanisediminis]|uniref:hypothetical protein n=1 Tax=Cytobacillus oceanisediminis TaxID=665099 RepID=UPI001FB34355|nr:hypothetical protein [Cytobacillus oceanisediminis]UOE58091.1 hypothetical protein IRB79_26615 [Cytobacillus oceanisediminis]
MKELKVILSPNYSGEEFVEAVSGITFPKTAGIEVYSIKLEDQKLSGIQSALRKNILLPYDRFTREFINGQNLQEKPANEEKQEIAEEAEVSIEPVKEAVIEAKEEAEAKKEPAKKPRKRTKKDAE